MRFVVGHKWVTRVTQILIERYGNVRWCCLSNFMCNFGVPDKAINVAVKIASGRYICCTTGMTKVTKACMSTRKIDVRTS